MLKPMGILDRDDLKELKEIAKNVMEKIENDEKEIGEKELIKVAKSPNYFIREELGKILASYPNQKKMYYTMKKFLNHKYYGVRATALFYFYNRYQSTPEKLIKILEITYKSTPWETESVIFELWKKHSEVMKVEMLKWIESEDSQKRAISFHGMENIAGRDPFYILDFIGKVIDDETADVQKKITHVLTQVARSKPAECYPYIREWLLNSNEIRYKTIWISMKKLTNIVTQKSRREKSHEFVLLTQRTINDWKEDSDKTVASVGKGLAKLIKK
jgi:3-methyladenine DNA glycosylase AlkC